MDLYLNFKNYKNIITIRYFPIGMKVGFFYFPIITIIL